MELALTLESMTALRPKASAVPASVAFQNIAGTTATSNAGDYVVTKTAVGDAWDSGARTTASLDADFIFRFQPSQSTEFIHCDLAADAFSTSVALGDHLHGCILRDDGTAEATWNTTPQGGGFAYAGGDYIFLRKAGTTITLLSGGTGAIGSATLRHTFAQDGSTMKWPKALIFGNGASVRVRAWAG
jgi:hypothetical protein